MQVHQLLKNSVNTRVVSHPSRIHSPNRKPSSINICGVELNIRMLHETLDRPSTPDFQGFHLDSVSGIAEDLSMGAAAQYVVRSAIVVIVVVQGAP